MTSPADGAAEADQPEEPPATRAGERMVAQLRAAHEPLRQDIVVLGRALGLLAESDTSHDEIRTMVAGLTVADALWRLKTNCEQYCLHLTLHHQIEDQRMFPTVLREFPELEDVMARLHEEHEQVAVLVDETKAAAAALDRDPATIERTRQALATLEGHLRSHLDYEEASLFPYFRRMQRDWHFG